MIHFSLRRSWSITPIISQDSKTYKPVKYNVGEPYCPLQNHPIYTWYAPNFPQITSYQHQFNTPWPSNPQLFLHLPHHDRFTFSQQSPNLQGRGRPPNPLELHISPATPKCFHYWSLQDTYCASGATTFNSYQASHWIHMHVIWRCENDSDSAGVSDKPHVRKEYSNPNCNR